MQNLEGGDICCDGNGGAEREIGLGVGEQLDLRGAFTGCLKIRVTPWQCRKASNNYFWNTRGDQKANVGLVVKRQLC